MRKIIVPLFLAALAFGSMYGCVIDDGHGRGRSGGQMDHHPGPGDRDDHHDNRKNDRDDHDRDHH